MLRGKYEPGIGLGRNGDEMANMVEFAENRGRLGLGYEPTHADKRRVALERKERSPAHLRRHGLQVERVLIGHIRLW